MTCSLAVAPLTISTAAHGCATANVSQNKKVTPTRFFVSSSDFLPVVVTHGDYDLVLQYFKKHREVRPKTLENVAAECLHRVRFSQHRKSFQLVCKNTVVNKLEIYQQEFLDILVKARAEKT